MTSRERVLLALNHKEPDRVPLDLGGTIMSGIMAQALDRLRKHLGLENRMVRVHEVFQMLGEVELDVIDRLDIDVLPVEPLIQFFGLRRESYKPWSLADGTEVAVPGQFEVETNERGDYLIRHGGDPTAAVEGRMPKDGYYFDMASMIDLHTDFVPPPLEEVREKMLRSDGQIEFMANRAQRLRRETDKALLMGAWGALGLGGVGSIPDFLCLLATDRTYIEELFAVRTETAIENLERMWRHVGEAVDIVGVDGTDYGSQRAEMFSPEWFEELYVEPFRKQLAWIHENTTWKTWLHSCGSIPKILPMLIDAGLDIINPVQCTAAGMEPRWLKDEFGDRVTFWGGGVDTQHTLPFGTSEEVAAEVAERVRIFAPGGGFVFNTIHNVQHGTPPANIVAAYETAKAEGLYPIKSGA